MKFIIIGGSSGIGLGMVENLIVHNEIIVYDIIPCPQEKAIYKYIDLSRDSILELKEDINNSDGVIYTAGLGKVNWFDNYSFIDVDKTISVNLSSLIKVILCCNEQLKSSKKFYCLVISSIAGLVSSPLFSIYSASKAGVCKYVEAVNTELKYFGSNNRISNVVATAFKGTSFNGGKTNIEELKNLVDYLINEMFKKTELIKVNPELVDSIIERYLKNPEKFSSESLEYKIKNKRI